MYIAFVHESLRSYTKLQCGIVVGKMAVIMFMTVFRCGLLVQNTMLD